MTATCCAVNTKEINKKKKNPLVYPNLESAIRPIPHCNEIPVAVFKGLPKLELPGSEEDQAFVLSTDSSSEDTVSDVGFPPYSLPQLFSQGKLNDLIRDLNLSKKSSELLPSRLKEKNIFPPGTLITFYRKCHIEFLPYFTQENDIVYCNDVAGLLQQFGVQRYDPQNWRLFIDSSKRSLKCVLLHNGNLYGSVPLGHSKPLKEKYDEIKFVLEKTSYKQHQYFLCVDLKKLGFLLWLQGGCTKFPCFLCLWDSKARTEHWTKKNWPMHSELIPASLNVPAPPLVECSKIVFPPLHIKLGITKQCVKALDKDGDCFKYICIKFPDSTMEKLKAGIVDGPQIRKLMNDANFCSFVNPAELSAWTAFTNVVKFFLGKTKAPNYKELVETLLTSLHQLGANMSIKLHFLPSHLACFPENLGDVSDEQENAFVKTLATLKFAIKVVGMPPCLQTTVGLSSIFYNFKL